MSRRYFFPASSFSDPPWWMTKALNSPALEQRSYGTRIASDISMDEWHSREADVLAWMRAAA